MESKFLSMNIKPAPICLYGSPAKSVFYAPSKLDYLPLPEHNLNFLASPFILYLFHMGSQLLHPFCPFIKAQSNITPSVKPL